MIVIINSDYFVFTNHSFDLCTIIDINKNHVQTLTFLHTGTFRLWGVPIFFISHVFKRADRISNQTDENSNKINKLWIMMIVERPIAKPVHD